MEYKIALIPGDGIGPEIVNEAKKVLDKVCEKYHHTFTYSEVLLGGASIDVHGVPLTDEAIATAKVYPSGEYPDRSLVFRQGASVRGDRR